jgi:hypothetical protein
VRQKLTSSMAWRYPRWASALVRLMGIVVPIVLALA